MAESFSISMRLQRVTTETAHVSVPVAEELWKPNPDGSGTKKIDMDKLMATAIELGKLPSTGWEVEGDPVITPHLLQIPPQ